MIVREKIDRIIGKTFADGLEELIIDSGKLQYSKREMVEHLGCANFVAAGKLNIILRKLHISTVKDLFDTDPISLARIKGIGESCLFVALCILDASNKNIEEWWGYKDNKLKFSSFKHNAVRRSKKRKQEV